MEEEGRGEGPSHRRPCLRPDRRRRAPAAAGDGELREELGVGRVWHRPCRPPRERRRGWGGFRVFCLYPFILEDAKMCFVGRAIASWDVSVCPIRRTRGPPTGAWSPVGASLSLQTRWLGKGDVRVTHTKMRVGCSL
jgi:hypothetical protein